MQIEYIETEKIKPYKNNPRINKQAVDYVANSIKEFGFKVPITIDKDYVIITGHTRFEASKLLKLKKVPCIVVKDLDENKIKAYRLADNKVSELARWDYEKLEEEIKNIKNISMDIYGFVEEIEDFNWEDVEDLEEDTYEEPEHKMYECPYCHHIDRADHFKKVRDEV